MQLQTRGLLNGALGVLIFSGSLPATRIAVMDFDPVFLTGARAVLAAVLAASLLVFGHSKRPSKNDLIPLIIVALCCVVAFPLLTAMALQHTSSAHAMVFIGALPLATAVFAVFRGSEKPRRPFWIFSVLGCGLVAGYALSQEGHTLLEGDVLMLAAVTLCGLGYAEGARLTHRLGGTQVISWALLLSLPVMLPVSCWMAPVSFSEIGLSAWLGLAYVSMFSMLIGFVFWYRGLAQGGVAAVSQLQLLQPFLGLVFAAFLLHENVTSIMLLTAIAVIGCVGGARKFAR